MRILLVGAGQIGSRHLQALARLPSAKEIVVVDPFAASLKTAEERFLQVAGAGNGKHVSYRSELPAGAGFDVAVVATDARVRFEIFKTLLERKTANRFILEKVLFVKPAHYKEAADLVKKSGIKAWVNCPMRTWPGYIELKSKLSGPIKMTVSGSTWGLACNSVHYLDLFNFLSGKTVDHLTINELDAGTLPSKRAGYLEVSGTLRGSSEGSSVSLTAWRQSSNPNEVTIEAPGLRFSLREDNQKYRIAMEAHGWQERTGDFRIPFQSELTDKSVTSIIKEDRCDLPDLLTAIRVHEPLINSVMAHFKENGIGGEECLIS